MPLVLCLLALTSTAVAAGEVLNLEQALGIAVRENPVIKALSEQVYAKKMEKRSSMAPMLPQVSASYGYLRNKDDTAYEMSDTYLPVVNEQEPAYYNNPGDRNIVLDPETGNPIFAYLPAQELKFADKSTFEFRLTVSQTLFAGGQLLGVYQIADNAYLAAGLESLKTTRELKLQVIQAYYGVIKARKFHAVALSSVASIRSQLEVAQAFFDEGMIPKNDLLVVQVRYAEAEQNLISALNGVRLAESAFNILLARNLAEEVLIESDLPAVQLEVDLEQAASTALETRQELRSLALQLDSALKGVRIARGAFLPGVAANYTYSRTGAHSDVEDGSWSAGVGLTWKLIEGGSHFSNLEKAQSQSTQLGYAIQSQRDQIGLEVKNAFLSAQESRERIEVAAKSIDAAQENLRINQDRYNLQVATSSDVLDAQALLDKAQTNYIAARVDYATAVAELKAAMGTL